MDSADRQTFAVDGVAASPDGSLVIAGTTNQGNNSANPPPTQVFVNKINGGSATGSAPLPFRIDAVLNAASLLDTPLSPGETMVIQGGGFERRVQPVRARDFDRAVGALRNTLHNSRPPDDVNLNRGRRHSERQRRICSFIRV
jgi:hypothetical protein